MACGTLATSALCPGQAALLQLQPFWMLSRCSSVPPQRQRVTWAQAVLAASYAHHFSAAGQSVRLFPEDAGAVAVPMESGRAFPQPAACQQPFYPCCLKGKG